MRRPTQLSIVVPAYNEEQLLAGTVSQLRSTVDALGLSVEIVIVDDGSRDRTGAIADELARELPGVRACHQPNAGIGGAFRTGASQASGEFVMLWPADMPATAADLAPYAERLGTADVIVGCRRVRVGYNALMRLNAWVYPRMVRALFGLALRDVNWIHAYRRELLLACPLTESGIPMLTEALVRLRDAGASFTEVDVEMKARTSGVPSASRPRVMVRTLRGLLAFWWRWRAEQRGGKSS